MRTAKLSIMGLTNFREDLWDQFVVPVELQDKIEDIIDQICMDYSDLELLYPDPDVMKKAIGLWSRHESPIWQRLVKIKQLEYEPLWNVDEHRKETRETRDDGEHSTNRSGTDSRTGARTGTDSETLNEDIERNREAESDGTTSKTASNEQSSHSESTSSSTTTNKSNTFNSGAMVDNNQQINSQQAEGDQTGSSSGTESGTSHDESTEKETTDRDQTVAKTSREDSTDSGQHAETESGTTANLRTDVYVVDRHGNIGTTSSQQLLKEEWEVSMLDPEAFIIESFKHKFCIMVY